MGAAMDMMRRIPPNETETALSALLCLLPEQSSDLLSQITLSNKNQPILEDGYFPSAYLRKVEIEANNVFAVYHDQLGVEEEGTAHNCLTSTIMLSLTTSAKSAGSFSLSGSIRRQLNLDPSAEDGHMCNMGKMIEEMEGKLRNSLDQVYLGKTKETVYMHS